MVATRRTEGRPRQQVTSSRRYLFHAVLALGAAAILLAGPSLGWNISTIHLVGTAALYCIVVIGVNVVLGFAGQITLGPAATFAVGAYLGGVLSVKYHWNPFLAIIPAVLLALVVGLAIGMPALRVGGFYLAMVTAIAALAVPSTAAILHSITGGGDGMSARPLSIGHHVLSDATAFRIIVVATLLAAAVSANISRSAWGRWFRCLKVNEAGTSALGVSVYQAKVISFAWSAVFGGLAGALFAPFELAINPSQFGFDLSTAFFVALVVGGFGLAWAPILGVALYYIAPSYVLPKSYIGLKEELIFACLIIAVVVLLPDGLSSAVDRLTRAVWRLIRGSPRDARAALATEEPSVGASVVAAQPPEAPPVDAGEPTDGRSPAARRDVATRTRAELPALLTRAANQDRTKPALVARDVVVRFGGVVALDGAGLEVTPGKVTALIGPNGSGKTTLLNVCSGFQTPNDGTIELEGVDVTKSPPHKRAAAGLGRTFQQPIVFTDLSGAENVMAGEMNNRPSSIAAALRLPSSRRHEREAAARAEALLHALGVEHLVDRSAAKSSVADSKILDLARALAIDPLVLLLDEPAAGLGLDEIAVLEAMVRATADAGVAVLLVEHDVAFVGRIADRVVALERGRVIAEGTPDEVRSHPDVLRSYFGDVDLVPPTDGDLGGHAVAVEADRE
jgi:ABC-type branched-subunit amino acid transport system ATPase component/ABC-type branched-subunit amino acid transport system permease subunit